MHKGRHERKGSEAIVASVLGGLGGWLVGEFTGHTHTRFDGWYLRGLAGGKGDDDAAYIC